MRLPPDLERIFEPYLRKRLDSTRSLKKRLQALNDGEQSAPRTQLSTACEQSLQGLLQSIQRKTTPLYVRLIHGAAEFYFDAKSSEDVVKAAKITDSVAATMGLEAQRIQEAWLKSSD